MQGDVRFLQHPRGPLTALHGTQAGWWECKDSSEVTRYVLGRRWVRCGHDSPCVLKGPPAPWIIVLGTEGHHVTCVGDLQWIPGEVLKVTAVGLERKELVIVHLQLYWMRLPCSESYSRTPIVLKDSNVIREFGLPVSWAPECFYDPLGWWMNFLEDIAAIFELRLRWYEAL